MTSQGLDACGGGGWTLVMKIDASKVFKDNRFHIELGLSSPNFHS